MVLLLALYVAVTRPFPSTAVSLHTCPSEQGLWSEGGGCPGAAAGGTPPRPAFSCSVLVQSPRSLEKRPVPACGMSRVCVSGWRGGPL